MNLIERITIARTADREHSGPGRLIGDRRRVLDLGGGDKTTPLPPYYVDWERCLLDAVPGPDVDIVLDPRRLAALEPRQFDAVYCAHVLERHNPHDIGRILECLVHVLRPEGFVEIRTPDVMTVIKTAVINRMEPDDVLYTSNGVPISAHDVIYGWGEAIATVGPERYAHRRGFSVRSLTASLEQAGFAKVWELVTESRYEIRALAFKSAPTAAQDTSLGPMKRPAYPSA
jgi:hypothetical protein